MNTGGFTEAIWHFAGYLHLTEEISRAEKLYFGDPQRPLPEDPADKLRDPVERLDFDDLFSRPIRFIEAVSPESYRDLPPLTLARQPAPATGLANAPTSSRRVPDDPVDPQSSIVILRSSQRVIDVEYQDGGMEGLIAIRQLNRQLDRDLLTSDAILNADGTPVLPPKLDLDRIFDAMVAKADNATPDDLPHGRGGTTESLIESFSARNARWAETGSPDSNGSEAAVAPTGRIVDGVASQEDLPETTLREIAPWRRAETGSDPHHSEASLTALKPTHGIATLAETGLNEQTNVAVILDINEATGSLIVAGDAFFSRGIVQINVLTDNDHIDIAIAGALKATALTKGNEVHNVAEFVTHDMTSSPRGAAGTPLWSVDVMPGNFYDVKSIVQFNDLDDSDRTVQAEAGTYFDFSSGANQQTNFTKVYGLDSYDIIIIGGNYHRADWIYQYNIMLDSDNVKLFATGGGSGSTTVTAGFNELTNRATIESYDSAEFRPMAQAHWDLMAALDSRATILTPNADWQLVGNSSGTLKVLYVPGDYYDVNVIMQVNLLIDADQSLQASAKAETTQGVAAGANHALNEAYIVDPGTLSTAKYLGGESYEESVLIQVNMITDSDTVTIHDTRTLVPELVAFAQHADFEDAVSHVMPRHGDPAQYDHLMSNMLS